MSAKHQSSGAESITATITQNGDHLLDAAITALHHLPLTILTKAQSRIGLLRRFERSHGRHGHGKAQQKLGRPIHDIKIHSHQKRHSKYNKVIGQTRAAVLFSLATPGLTAWAAAAARLWCRAIGRRCCRCRAGRRLTGWRRVGRSTGRRLATARRLGGSHVGCRSGSLRCLLAGSRLRLCRLRCSGFASRCLGGGRFARCTRRLGHYRRVGDDRRGLDLLRCDRFGFKLQLAWFLPVWQQQVWQQLLLPACWPHCPCPDDDCAMTAWPPVPARWPLAIQPVPA